MLKKILLGKEINYNLKNCFELLTFAVRELKWRSVKKKIKNFFKHHG